MNTLNHIPNEIYTTLSESRYADEDISRDDRIALVINMYIDKIFMAMFCSRNDMFKKSYSSISHIHRAYLKINLSIDGHLKKVSLNILEDNALRQLHQLANDILNSYDVTRIVSTLPILESIIKRSTVPFSQIDSTIKSLRFVLAVANQCEYEDISIVVPYIRIEPNTFDYMKGLRFISLDFRIKRHTGVISTSTMWYRMFEGIRFSRWDDDFFTSISALCNTINIGILPNASSGLGISAFLYESFISSKILAEYVRQTEASIVDYTTVTRALCAGNPWLNIDKLNSIISASLEADETDTLLTEDTSSDTGDLTDDDNTEEDGTLDKSADGSSIDENNPPDGGLNNTDESKPLLLGLSLALVANETLDGFMYKLRVARYIDTVIEFNRDELPTETVTLLTNWKSMLLFLTDAEETKRLLKELKITMK